MYKTFEEIPGMVRNAFAERGIALHDVTVWNYHRWLKYNKLYMSEIYGRATKTSSSTVLFFDEGVK